MGVVTLFGLVLHMRDVDRDTTSLLFGSLVDLIEREALVEGRVLIVQHLRDGRRQRGLTVVDVTDGADIHVRLGPLELRLRHLIVLLDLLSDRVNPGHWVFISWLGKGFSKPFPAQAVFLIAVRRWRYRRDDG